MSTPPPEERAGFLAAEERHRAWRAEYFERTVAEPWWEDWVAFNRTPAGSNPMRAFEAGWHAGQKAR